MLIKKNGITAMQGGFQQMISLALRGALGAKKREIMALLDVDRMSCGTRRKNRK